MHIIKSNGLIEQLKYLSLMDGKIARAYETLFYYGKGSDVICISKSKVSESYTVILPAICSIKASDIEQLMFDMKDKVEAQIIEESIPYGKQFLFDVSRAKIVTRDRFVNFVPTGITNSLFIMVEKDNKWDNCFYGLADSSEAGAVSALAFFNAKMKLSRTQNEDWTKEGKFLLSFILAHTNYRKYKFDKPIGPWMSVPFDFKNNRELKVSSVWSKVAIDKIQAIGKNLAVTKMRDTAMSLNNVTGDQKLSPSPQIVDEVYDDSPFGITPYEAHDKGVVSQFPTVSLTDLIHLGPGKFYQGGYQPVIIDMQTDVYKEMSLDGREKMVIVALQPGQHKTPEEICSDLGVEEAIIVDNIGDLHLGEA